jgi:hypothetical protein
MKEGKGDTVIFTAEKMCMNYSTNYVEAHHSKIS